MSTFPPPPPLPGSRIESNRPYVAVAIAVAALAVLVPVTAVLVLQLQDDDPEPDIPSDRSFGDAVEMPVGDDGRQHPGEAPVTVPDLPLPPDWDVDFWGPEGSCVDTAGSPVACARVHMGEVFARVRIPGQAYPGEQELADEGTSRCNDAYLELTGESAGGRGVAIVPSPPSNRAWDGGQHRVVCLALSLGAGTRGSIADGA